MWLQDRTIGVVEAHVPLTTCPYKYVNHGVSKTANIWGALGLCLSGLPNPGVIPVTNRRAKNGHDWHRMSSTNRCYTFPGVCPDRRSLGFPFLSSKLSFLAISIHSLPVSSSPEGAVSPYLLCHVCDGSLGCICRLLYKQIHLLSSLSNICLI